MKCVSGKIMFCEWKEAVFEKYMSVYRPRKRWNESCPISKWQIQHKA